MSSALHKQGHKVIKYLDDSSLVGDTLTECQEAVFSNTQLFTKLVFQDHPDKSQFINSQELESAGFVINSKLMSFRLTLRKQQKGIDVARKLLSKKSGKISGYV